MSGADYHQQRIPQETSNVIPHESLQQSAFFWPIYFNSSILEMYLAGYDLKTCARHVIEQLLRQEETESQQVQSHPYFTTGSSQRASSTPFSPMTPGTPKVPLPPTSSPPAKSLTDTAPTTPIRVASTTANQLLQFYQQQTQQANRFSFLNLRHRSSDQAIILEDVADHYRLLDFLESYLHAPDSFIAFQHFPISLQERKKLITLYYEPDLQLMRLLLGTRLSKAEIDNCIELQSHWNESFVTRNGENMKRICKYVCSGYRQKDGASIPKTKILHQAVTDYFALPPELSNIYGAAIFAYEHHLQCSTFQTLSFDEIAIVCSALEACFCDASGLLMNEGTYLHMSKLKGHLSDSKIIQELHIVLFGEAPQVSRWSTALGKATERREIASSSNLDLAALSGGMPNSLTGSGSGVLKEGSEGGGTSLSEPNQAASSNALLPTASRKLIVEFPAILKTLAKIAAQFCSKKDMRELVDSIQQRIIAPSITSSSGVGMIPNSPSPINASGSFPSKPILNPSGSSPASTTTVTPTAVSPSQGSAPSSPPIIAQRNTKELSALFSLLMMVLPNLTSTIPKKVENAAFEQFVKNFFGVIKIMIQISMSHLATESQLPNKQCGGYSKAKVMKSMC